MALDIIGVTAPASAHIGETVNFIVHTQNTGYLGAPDTFRVELSGDLIDAVEFSLAYGLTKDLPFSFVMPNKNASITINAYHWEEEVGWVWDISSVWELLFPFMNIQDRPYKQ